MSGNGDSVLNFKLHLSYPVYVRTNVVTQVSQSIYTKKEKEKQSSFHSHKYMKIKKKSFLLFIFYIYY